MGVIFLQVPDTHRRLCGLLTRMPHSCLVETLPSHFCAIPCIAAAITIGYMPSSCVVSCVSSPYAKVHELGEFLGPGKLHASSRRQLAVVNSANLGNLQQGELGLVYAFTYMVRRHTKPR